MLYTIFMDTACSAYNGNMSFPAHIAMPDSLTGAILTRVNEADLPRWALEALVLEAVREKLITRGYGGEILGFSFQEREEFYLAKGITYDLDAEDIAQEKGDAKKVFGN